jgi:hypothetical protein
MIGQEEEEEEENLIEAHVGSDNYLHTHSACLVMLSNPDGAPSSLPPIVMSHSS